MKKVFALILVSVLCAACDDKGGGGKLDEIAKLTQAAKKSIDFIKIKTECGLLESKNPEAKKDKKYIDVCVVGPLEARAKLAMAEGAGSNNCAFVTMDIESAIKDNIEPGRMKKLLADVNKACGN
jgi:hypothetical protein